MEYDLNTIDFIKNKFAKNNLKGHVLAIIVENNKILLIKRLNSSTKNDLCLPGGNIAKGESFISGIKRETLEELGIRIENVKTVSNLENRYLLNGKCLYKSKGKIFLATKYSGIITTNQRELKGFQWCNVNEIPKLKFKNDEILKYIFGKEKYLLNLNYSRQLQE
jgi:ADP-ribose pyrophosphatase YjhB (NUDIX family)